MQLLYAFPEPLPLPRARGVQVAHAVASLAATGTDIDLAYVPAGADPFAPTGGPRPAGTRLLPLSRGWPSPLDRLPPFSRWHSVRFFAGRLIREIASRRPDLLYVRHLKLAALLLKHRGLPPLVYEAHEVFADTAGVRRQARMAAMESLVVRHAAAVVCNSRATARRLGELYGAPRRLLILPNGVAPLAGLPDKPWADCRRHVVYAGSFFGWKGVADLVAAAGQLPGFRLTLIGGEPEQLERLRTSQPSSGAEIELLPRCSHSDVAQRLASACIAVLPNRPDPDSAFTSPIKLFEYMAAGCAVVAADLPPIREILDAGEAAWFRPGDADDLARALRVLADDCVTAQRMGERLLERSAAYTWNARAKKLSIFCRALLSSAND